MSMDEAYEEFASKIDLIIVYGSSALALLSNNSYDSSYDLLQDRYDDLQLFLRERAEV